MAQNPPDVSSVQASRGRRSVLPARTLWLWLALFSALALARLADAFVMQFLEPLNHSPFADLLSNTVRWLGNGKFQIPAMLLMIGVGAILARRVYRAGGWALLAFLVSGAIANIIKVVVHRPRPWVELPPPESWSGYLHTSELQSFPSGDSTTTFAIATVLGLMFPRLRVPLLIVAVIVAIARVLVGSHYPSDVCAGAMLGLAVGRLVARSALRRERQGSTDPT